MAKPIECVLGADLLPWEKAYFRLFLKALQSRGDVSVCEQPAKISGARSVWVVAHDWRKAVQEIPSHYKGSVTVSVLGIGLLRRFFGFFPRPWNPSRFDIRLLAHSPFAFRYLKEMERVPANKLQLLPLPGLLSDGEAPADGLYTRVGCLSSLNADANLAFLVSVAHYVSRLNLPVRFVVARHGRFAEHLRAMTDDMGLSAYFESLDDQFGMDVLLHAPWKTEHFIPLLLKGGQGVPVLTCDVPGVEQLVSDGHDGFIFPVNEVKPIGELIARLTESPTLRHALGDRFRQGLAKRFPLDRLLGQFETAIQVGEFARSVAKAA